MKLELHRNGGGTGLRIVEAVALEHKLSSSMCCGEETRPVPLFVGEEETMCVDPSAMEKRLVLVDLSSSHTVERRYFSRKEVSSSSSSLLWGS